MLDTVLKVLPKWKPDTTVWTLPYWNNQDCKTENDQMALLRTYSKSNGTINEPPVLSTREAYTHTTKFSFSEYQWK